MRFSETFAALLVAPLVVAHGHNHGLPKIVGLGRDDIGMLKSRNILGGRAARATPPQDGPQLQARQGGLDGRCGPDFGCAVCAENYCCSSAGWCGQGADYCSAPDCLFNYGPACDANKVPSGGSTRNTARTKLGSQPYGGEGIYACKVPGTVAITYDDGPYSYTSALLDLLAKYQAKATFFVTGINIAKGAIDETAEWKTVIQKMVAQGHQVASHTWSHQDLSAITKEQRYDQMIRNEMAISNIIGKFPTYMRPPYSSCTAASGCQKDMTDLGYVVSYFDLDTDDYNNLTPEKIQNAKDNVYDIINPSNPTTNKFQAIAHDIHQLTAVDLSTYMLDLIKQKGYKMVTLGECLGEPVANWYRTPDRSVASSSAFSAPSGCGASSSVSVSASATSSASTATATAVSPDGSCGAASKYTCLGFSQGECCSPYNYCGSTSGHCGDGCQKGFGKCGLSSSSLASSGTSAVASSKAATSSTVRASTVSSAPSSSSTAKVSVDGSCGGSTGYTCAGFSEGECCSQYGWCGSSTTHCSTGCNPLFGKCTSSGTSLATTTRAATSTKPSTTSIKTSTTSTKTSAAATATKKVSTDSTCGGTKGFTCKGSTFGSCCSQYGWCGSTTGHCRASSGCQSGFGTCT